MFLFHVTHRSARRTCSALLGLTVLLAGCATSPPSAPPARPAPPVVIQADDSHLATFTTRLAGGNVVPPVRVGGSGTLDALLDRRTGLLRWKMTYRQLSGPVTEAYFHGPAEIGANAAPVLRFHAPVRSAYEGRATLTREQAAELLAGRWYVSLQTARHPGGELRGQLIERK